jgi:hypothetical protein
LNQSAPALPRSPEEILNHPDFAKARYEHCAQALMLFSDVNFTRANMAVGRNLLFSVLMCLRAGYDPEDRLTWPTLARVIDILGELNIGSRRMAEDFIARLRAMDFVVEVPAPQDRRSKLFMPTERMIEHDRRYSAALFAGLTALPSKPYFSAAMVGEPHFHMALRRVGLANIRNTPKLFGRHRDLIALFNRDGAYGLICWIVVEVTNASPAFLSFTEVSRRLAVSRSHVRNVIDELAAAAMVGVSGQGDERRIEACEALYALLDPFLADIMSVQDRLAWLIHYGETDVPFLNGE